MRRTWAVGILLLGLAAPALAWSHAGHMTFGALTYDVLKQESPAAVPRILALLKEHPHFADKWQKRLEERDGERKVFMEVARWADVIRGDEKYDRPDWHFINLPYKPADQPASVRTVPPEPDNLLRAFETNLATAGDKSKPRAERAVAVGWLFHLVADAHQPLHVVSLYTTDYRGPGGDRGGTRFFIQAEKEKGVISLHEFWDDLLGTSTRYADPINDATKLRGRPELGRAKLPELAAPEFSKWVQDEGVKIAQEVAYRNGKLEGSPNRQRAPLLPTDYAGTVQPVAERRIVIAAYRLADLLKQLPP